MEVFDFVNFGALASGQTSILLQQMLSQVSVVLVASRAGNNIPEILQPCLYAPLLCLA